MAPCGPLSPSVALLFATIRLSRVLSTKGLFKPLATWTTGVPVWFDVRPCWFLKQEPVSLYFPDGLRVLADLTQLLLRQSFSAFDTEIDVGTDRSNYSVVSVTVSS